MYLNRKRQNHEMNSILWKTGKLNRDYATYFKNAVNFFVT